MTLDKHVPACLKRGADDEENRRCAFLYVEDFSRRLGSRCAPSPYPLPQGERENKKVVRGNGKQHKDIYRVLTSCPFALRFDYSKFLHLEKQGISMDVHDV